MDYDITDSCFLSLLSLLDKIGEKLSETRCGWRNSSQPLYVKKKIYLISEATFCVAVLLVSSRSYFELVEYRLSSNPIHFCHGKYRSNKRISLHLRIRSNSLNRHRYSVTINDILAN